VPDGGWEREKREKKKRKNKLEIVRSIADYEATPI